MSAFSPWSPDNNVQAAFSPWAPKNNVKALLKKLGENEAWKMFSKTINEPETETDEPEIETNNTELETREPETDTSDSLDKENLKAIEGDNDVTNTSVKDEFDDVDRSEMITESDGANDTLMQTLSEDDIQRLRDIANKNRDVTESDKEALLKSSDTSSAGSELNFTGLSEIDARNDETEEVKANNSGKTINIA